MDIQAEKLNRIQWLAGINDSNIIRQVNALRALAEKVPSEKLSQAEKDAIDKGLQSVKDGRHKSHEEVMKVTRNKYPHVIK